MSSEPEQPIVRTLAVHLDSETYAALSDAAIERGIEPAALLERWMRERLAHERERRLGRARPQR